MLRLIDATPIPLDDLVAWADWNGRTRGLKLHVVYDPGADHPRDAVITAANVNDVTIGRTVPIEAGATYVFDKAYCDYAWWTRINEGKAFFITRKKRNARFVAVRRRGLRKRSGDGFTVIEDAEVKLVTQGRSRLHAPMRRIRVKRDDGGKLVLITNDLKRPAVEIRLRGNERSVNRFDLTSSRSSCALSVRLSALRFGQWSKPRQYAKEELPGLHTCCNPPLPSKAARRGSWLQSRCLR